MKEIMLLIISGMKQRDHFCFPLHRKSQQTSFVVITSVFEITYMTRWQGERERGAVSGAVMLMAQTWSEHQKLRDCDVWLLKKNTLSKMRYQDNVCECVVEFVCHLVLYCYWIVESLLPVILGVFPLGSLCKYNVHKLFQSNQIQLIEAP